MPGASLALFADLGACHVQKSSVTICVLPAPFRWKETSRDFAKSNRVSDFYPRPPGGGRHLRGGDWLPEIKFLSTPSGWRATESGENRDIPKEISIHALRVEGDQAAKNCLSARRISIHALRVEGDGFDCSQLFSAKLFLSTPSGWRATLTSHGIQQRYLNFYPRPPGGGRPVT